MIGVGSFLSGIRLTSEMVVLSPGSAYRPKADLVRREFERHGMLTNLLLHYRVALIAEIGQNVACNRHYSVEQRLCRWVMEVLDRVPSKELTITHSMIADILGVRREGVTVAVGNLDKAGVFHCRCGHVAVLDRAGLEARSCECTRLSYPCMNDRSGGTL